MVEMDSRSDRISAKFFAPSTFRRVVAASSLVGTITVFHIDYRNNWVVNSVVDHSVNGHSDGVFGEDLGREDADESFMTFIL